MKKTLRLDAEADEEIAHAIDRYEDEREGLGLEFFTEFTDAIDRLDEPGRECEPLPISAQSNVRHDVIGYSTRAGARRTIVTCACCLSY
jgi:hypothetical protein